MATRFFIVFDVMIAARPCLVRKYRFIPLNFLISLWAFSLRIAYPAWVGVMLVSVAISDRLNPARSCCADPAAWRMASSLGVKKLIPEKLIFWFRVRCATFCSFL